MGQTGLPLGLGGGGGLTPQFPACRAISGALWGTWQFGARVKVPGLEPYRPGLRS